MNECGRVGAGYMRYVGKIHRMILKALPGTDAEIAERLGVSVSRVNPARWDLVQLGLVEQDGWRTRDDGRRLKVWRQA